MRALSEATWQSLSPAVKEICRDIVAGNQIDRNPSGPFRTWRTGDDPNDVLPWDDAVAATARLGARLDAFRAGSGAGPIQAEDLRRALIVLDECPNPEETFRGTVNLDPRGLYVRNAWIEGCLDLQRAEVPVAISFENCVFSGGIHLRDGDLSTVHMRNCLVPFIAAQRITVRGVFAILNSFLPFGLSVDGGRLSGDLMLGGTVACSPAVFRNGLGGGVNSELAEEIAGRALQVAFNRAADSQLQQSPANEDGWPHPALMFLGKRAQEEFLHGRGRFKGIIAAFLDAYCRTMIERPNLAEGVDGGPSSSRHEIRNWHRYCEQMKERAVSASNVHVEQNLDCAPTARIVEKRNRPGDHEPAPFCAFGQFALSSSTIDGSVKMEGARLLNIWRDPDLKPGDNDQLRRVTTLKADGVRVAGEFNICDGFESYGAVRFTTAKIGASCFCSDARFHCFNMRESYAGRGVAATTAKVSRRSVFFDSKELRAHAFAKPAEALKLQGTQIESTLFLKSSNRKRKPPREWGIVQGYLCLRDTKAKRLSDDKGALPDKGFLILDGFEYDGFTESSTNVGGTLSTWRLNVGLFGFPDQPVDMLLLLLLFLLLFPLSVIYFSLSIVQDTLAFLYEKGAQGVAYVRASGRRGGRPIDRLEWLLLQPAWHTKRTREKTGLHDGEGFRPQPYETLARALKNNGLEAEARIVQMHKNLLKMRNTREIYSRMWHRVLGLLTSFGYDPWKSGRLLSSLIFLSWFAFGIANNNGIISIRDDEMRAVLSVDSPHLAGKMEIGDASERGRLATLDLDFSEREGLDLLLTPAKTETKGHGVSYPMFSPLAYSLDLAIPFLELDQKRYWGPFNRGAKAGGTPECGQGRVCVIELFGEKIVLPEEWRAQRRFFHRFEWSVISLGFLFTTTFAAGLSGIMKR